MQLLCDFNTHDCGSFVQQPVTLIANLEVELYMDYIINKYLLAYVILFSILSLGDVNQWNLVRAHVGPSRTHLY